MPRGAAVRAYIEADRLRDFEALLSRSPTAVRPSRCTKPAESGVTRIGHGFDAHRLVEGRRFILGGVAIPFETRVRSDIRMPTCSRTRSLTRCSAPPALGDLGGRFPDNEAKWKDADSMDVARACAREVHDAGYTVANVDATIVLQRPRLAPHIGRMRRNIAGRLGLTLERVSVKAKTSEEMGYTGDGTGIAAYAVALVETST